MDVCKFQPMNSAIMCQASTSLNGLAAALLSYVIPQLGEVWIGINVSSMLGWALKAVSITAAP